ncbi:hypothetical protein BV25DRAFT_1829023 [Artomyces pyxidatus]|uniref:Uncharacterized protein n=1 Tax=Artomyces pyxidatus TaxID=48021 RepID=A0ACB8STF2_9AGAM|nr:hypothetical protein BV25DRAFT_1829023 [Artomyces pyxidatus]
MVILSVFHCGAVFLSSCVNVLSERELAYVYVDFRPGNANSHLQPNVRPASGLPSPTSSTRSYPFPQYSDQFEQGHLTTTSPSAHFLLIEKMRVRFVQRKYLAAQSLRRTEMPRSQDGANY